MIIGADEYSQVIILRMKMFFLLFNNVDEDETKEKKKWKVWQHL
jgi:hypothetical protein